MTQLKAPDATLIKLFAPIDFGSEKLVNRLVMAPMTRDFATDGVVGDDVVDYYRRRVEGGIGLIITEGTLINHVGANAYKEQIPRFYGDDALNGWKKVVEAVHQAGGHIIPQLWHTGAVRKPGGAGKDPSAPGYGPMDIEGDNGELECIGMSLQDISEVIQAYVQAAVDAERIGFDGIEIHGAHGYLIDQFFWEEMNQRDDQYGGSLENRNRFALEIVKAIRASVSKDFPIVFRFSQWKQQDYSAKLAQTSDELATLLNALSQAGVDIFHASTRRFWEPAFDNSPLTVAAWTRKITSKPVIAVGSVGLDTQFGWELWNQPEDKHQTEVTNVNHLLNGFENNDFDFIAVGRALIADAQWAQKVQQGRFDEIVPFERELLDSLV